MYDSGDHKLDNSNYNVKDNNNFNVDFVVYKQKTYDLKVNITGTPEGFDKSILPVKLSKDSISVITPDLNAPDNETVEIGSIPLNTVNFSKTYNFDVPLKDGEINTSGSGNIKVSFDKEGFTSGDFTLYADNIDIIGAPAALESVIDPDKLPTVTLYGTEEAINDLSDNDVHATVQLTDIKGTGTYPKEAKIYIDGQNNIWSVGTTEVQIIVSKPKTDDESSSADSSEAE